MSRRAAAGLIAALLLALPASAQGQAYIVPTDNPYVGTAGARAEIYLYGMRNPYRWSFDRANGDIYVGDVGGDKEEVTYLPAATAAGANLGWDCLSGTIATSEFCFPPRYVGPAFEYDSSSDVVIGGYVVRDPTLPGYQGRYLFGRFASGEISMLGPGASGASMNSGVDIDGVSGFGEDGAGGLYAVSLTGGTLHRFVESGSALRTDSSGGFDQPVAVAAPEGDPNRLFVVEKAGQVKLRASGGVGVFLDIRDQVADAGEQGLLAMAVAPDYATSGRVFVYYTTNAGDLQLDEYRRAAAAPERADPATRRPLLTIPHPAQENHNGGQLLFGPDRRLYLSTGDGGGQGDPENDARSLGSLLGKMLRLDVGVSAPPVTPPAAPAPEPEAPPAPAPPDEFDPASSAAAGTPAPNSPAPAPTPAPTPAPARPTPAPSGGGGEFGGP